MRFLHLINISEFSARSKRFSPVFRNQMFCLSFLSWMFFWVSKIKCFFRVFRIWMFFLSSSKLYVFSFPIFFTHFSKLDVFKFSGFSKLNVFSNFPILDDFFALERVLKIKCFSCLEDFLRAFRSWTVL